MKIIISEVLGFILLVPLLFAVKLYARNKRIKWIYAGLVLTTFMSILFFNFLLEFRLPSNTFEESRFKETYKEIFQLEFPTNYSLISKKYTKEGGLYGTEIWTASILFNEIEYLKLLNRIKEENEILLKDFTEDPVSDCETGHKIVYTIKTNYMNPWNYNIDFFQDKRTVRIELTIFRD